MSVDFDCLSGNFNDRFEYMHCLERIKQGYQNSQYVDVDDICRFLQMIRPTLYKIIDQLNRDSDAVGLSSVIEDVFNIILHIHERTKEKIDLLEEFNEIHRILEEFETRFGLKMKLSILKNIYDQCKVYYNRPTDELQEAKKKRQEDRIEPSDYAFLRD